MGRTSGSGFARSVARPRPFRAMFRARSTTENGRSPLKTRNSTYSAGNRSDRPRRERPEQRDLGRARRARRGERDVGHDEVRVLRRAPAHHDERHLATTAAARAAPDAPASRARRRRPPTSPVARWSGSGPGPRGEPREDERRVAPGERAGEERAEEDRDPSADRAPPEVVPERPVGLHREVGRGEEREERRGEEPDREGERARATPERLRPPRRDPQAPRGEGADHRPEDERGEHRRAGEDEPPARLDASPGVRRCGR